MRGKPKLIKLQGKLSSPYWYIQYRDGGRSQRISTGCKIGTQDDEANIFLAAFRLFMGPSSLASRASFILMPNLCSTNWLLIIFCIMVPLSNRAAEFKWPRKVEVLSTTTHFLPHIPDSPCGYREGWAVLASNYNNMVCHRDDFHQNAGS